MSAHRDATTSGSPRSRSFPVPTSRALSIGLALLLPTVFSLARPTLVIWVLAADALLLLFILVDFVAAPPASALRVQRSLEPLISSAVVWPVELTLALLAPSRPVRGLWRDHPPRAFQTSINPVMGTFVLTRDEPVCRAHYTVTAEVRGDFRWQTATLRLLGPLGLCSRQTPLALESEVKVYPDLRALSQEALRTSGMPTDGARLRAMRGREGGEFESLREYRTGDDFRSIDWKATARRGRPVVRVHQPEQHQPVMFFIDCGRHMAGTAYGRRKLDHAIDACLRLARVCLEAGDHVGVVAFARRVSHHVVPSKGIRTLQSVVRALYPLEATLEESNYTAAVDTALSRQHKRTLAVLFTDLMDPQTSSALVRPLVRLRPQHLPLVVSLYDEALARTAAEAPGQVHAAYARQVAANLEDEYRKTTLALKNAGVWVVRANAQTLSAKAINQYLDLKRRGMA